MYLRSHLLAVLAVISLIQCQLYDTNEILVDPSKHNEQFFTFLSRPDIDAPRWDIKVYNESARAPGYWFVSSYGIVQQSDNDKRYVAPAIYDSTNGELVWNGGPLFNYFVTFTFKVSRFEGHDMLSVFDLTSKDGTIIDAIEKYRVHRHVRVDGNPHEFQVIENGARALYVTKLVKRTSPEDSLRIGYDGRCRVAFPGFQERKISTEEITFDWKPENKISLDESYLYRGEDTPTSGDNTPGGDCPDGPFDYLHLNSVEKLEDGDFLISGRRTYTIYKISHKDGSIIWRLGDWNTHFNDGQRYGRTIFDERTTGYFAFLFQVSLSEDMSSPVCSGKAYTSSDLDYTVKVEATGLQPFTYYYYQFSVCEGGRKSPIGRTKTAPHPDDHVTEIGLAVYSCSNYPFGFFNAYGNPVRKDSVDYVLHLGDYIYEYAGTGDYGYGYSIGRVPAPYGEIIFTLYDYRARLSAYRQDVDLQNSHAYFPWIPVWDDHEVADNTYRDGSSELNNTEASFIADGGVSVDQRKMNAVRAYFEWMPIRQVEMDDNLRVWRSFQLGSLLDLIILDTRQYDRSITDLYWNTEYVHQISEDAGRSLMGSRQENWFYRSLGASADRGAAWRIVGSQIVFSRLNESVAYGKEGALNADSWDGYQSNKNRTLNYLYENNIGNNIVIAGDSHASWVSDLAWLDQKPYNFKTGAGAIGVEFAGSAVTSPCPFGQNITLDQSRHISNVLIKDNQELQWSENYYRGYFELHISYDEVVANYFGMPTVVSRNPYEISLANFTVRSGENRLARPIGGGVAEHGALKGGEIRETNLTHNTLTGRYFISHFDQEDL